MARTISDRGQILHFAGFHHLSPALDAEGRPMLVSGARADLVRCGWERFFERVEAGGLALSFDPDEPSSARFVAAPRAPPPGLISALGEAVRHSRRFLRALFDGGARP